MLDLIRERRNRHYTTLLMIAQNPYAEEPNALFNQLRGGVTGTARSEISAEIDHAGIKRLKGTLAKSRLIEVK